MYQKEYKTRNRLLGNVMLKVLFQWLEFDNTKKFYNHKSQFILENETHKILKDFAIQTNHLIVARRPDQVLINKEKN